MAPTMGATTLLWLRQDLRLRDNTALRAAAARGLPVIPVYIWSPEEEGGWAPGAASRWWLNESLQALEASLREVGLRLILRVGPTLDALYALLAETGADAVYWSRRYEPAAQALSHEVRQALRHRGVDARGFNSTLLAEPSQFVNQAGMPYQVYTPFMRAMLSRLDPPAPEPVPRTLKAPPRWPVSLPLGALELKPGIAWYTRMAARWRPGEAGALARLKQFVRLRLADYERSRELPASAGTSGLSAHLHFGEIGPRQIWHAVKSERHRASFLHELLWREFGYHLLHHFPRSPTEPLREEFAHFPWRQHLRGLARWQRGETGIPMVDAGMRELWATGVMHNRVRMIVGSFLVKNLLLPWQEGARWFWDTLLDADLASNTLNWQWVAGCGADAAPYFRVFNPVLQGRRFDPQGKYVRHWIPELDAAADRHVHSPWLAPSPPKGYPAPRVDLNATRQAALDAYQAMRKELEPPR
jgi:deoxyribodipyrimidine photo-lyase